MLNQFQRIIRAIIKILVAFCPAPKLFDEYLVLDFKKLAREAYENARIKFWDSKYYATSMEEWRKIFTNVLMEMPVYIPNKFDCENFGFYVSSLVSARFKLNSCGVASGTNTEGNPHGFNIFFGEGKFHILEPQTGDIDPKYTVNEINFW